MASSKPSQLRAILSSIEFQRVVGNEKQRTLPQYFMELSVADKVIVKPTDSKPLSQLNWEWNAGHEILFEPSSVIKVVLLRKSRVNINVFDHLVVQYKGKVEDLLNNDAIFSLTDKKGNPVPAKMKIAIALSPTQTNDYRAIGGPSDEQAETAGSVVYEGLKMVIQGLYDCSDMFLPLKTAAGGILTVIKFVETVLDNKTELEALEAKLGGIVSIVKQYKENGGLDVIDHRIKIFCDAMAVQLKKIEDLKNQAHVTSAALAKKNAGTIQKVLQNISGLCDVFQMDTQLNIEVTVGEIVKHLDSGLIDKLNHEMTSYKLDTRLTVTPPAAWKGPVSRS